MDMDYQALYYMVLEENKRLKAELDALKREYGLPISTPKPTSVESISVATDYDNANANISPRVTMHSATEKKIELFMSLFRGRDDLYARRWHSRKTGKSGYSPACANEWQPGLCDRRKQKCAVCPNRRLLPLNDAVIDAHLRGHQRHGCDVVGLYPMTEGECCYFLAVDFDGPNWQDDVVAFKETCREEDIPVYIERSRSGNGSHAWFFFEEKIAAALARKLGSALLTHTMNKRHELKLASYDRLFPNQDTMPAGGFGSLIALPLQGLARKQGNSVFIDESFRPYPDQWAFLSGVIRLTPEQVERHILHLCADGELGTLAAAEESENDKPWEKKPTPASLTKADFPETVIITYANMVYVNKSGISQSALNRIKRIAAFRNPEFYKAQAMRLPTRGKPRVIDCSTEDMRYLCIPRGCFHELTALLEEAGVQYSVHDESNPGRAVDVFFRGTLLDEQTPAVEELMAHDIGVLAAAPAFGKTVVAANIIARKKVNALVLVHTGALLSQWKKALGQFLTFPEKLTESESEPELEPGSLKKRGRKKEQSRIGQLGAGKKMLNGNVDVAIMQSLVSKDEVKELVRDYGLVIVDECHHVPAFSFEKILKTATAKHVYGLTATPARRDGHHPIIFMHCGPVRYQVDAKAQAAKRDFEHFVVPRFTNFKRPINIAESNFGIAAAYAALNDNDTRNRRIIQDVIDAVQEGRRPIVLTQRAAHVEILSTSLSKSCKNVFSLTGGGSGKEKRQVLESLDALPAAEPFVIVATGKYVGEGFDYPRLDTLFLAMPISWKGTLQQYAGRLHREYAGKSEVIIYDYVDIHVKMLENMYHKRLHGYAAIGYKAKCDGAPPEKVGVIFDNKNFLRILSDDLERTASVAVIVSPYLRKPRVKSLSGLLAKTKLNGASVTIVTRPINSYKPLEQPTISELMALLRDLGCTMIERPGIHQKFAVLDNRVVWYGSINFLSYGGSEESVMRFENREIAEELLDILT